MADHVYEAAIDLATDDPAGGGQASAEAARQGAIRRGSPGRASRYLMARQGPRPVAQAVPRHHRRRLRRGLARAAAPDHSDLQCRGGGDGHRQDRHQARRTPPGSGEALRAMYCGFFVSKSFRRHREHFYEDSLRVKWCIGGSLLLSERLPQPGDSPNGCFEVGGGCPI